jgi:hypothetical protein
MKIIISPYSQRLKDDKKNAKNYPYWNEVISSIKHNNHITQIGVSYETKLEGVHDFKTNLNFKQLEELVRSSDIWMSVDNFFPHFCNSIGIRGIVIFSKSDPKIFGYPTNINLLKDRSYLRPDQFGLWNACEFDETAFLDPRVIIELISKLTDDKSSFEQGKVVTGYDKMSYKL